MVQSYSSDAVRRVVPEAEICGGRGRAGSSAVGMVRQAGGQVAGEAVAGPGGRRRRVREAVRQVMRQVAEGRQRRGRQQAEWRSKKQQWQAGRSQAPVWWHRVGVGMGRVGRGSAGRQEAEPGRGGSAVQAPNAGDVKSGSGGEPETRGGRQAGGSGSAASRGRQQSRKCREAANPVQEPRYAGRSAR